MTHTHPTPDANTPLFILHTLVFSILVPAAIGVAAGIFASILGLLIGSLVSYCWIRFVRGGRRGDASASSAQGGDDEKTLLARKLEGQDVESARSRLMNEFSGRSDGVAGYASGQVSEDTEEEEELPVYESAPEYVEKA